MKLRKSERVLLSGTAGSRAIETGTGDVALLPDLTPKPMKIAASANCLAGLFEHYPAFKELLNTPAKMQLLHSFAQCERSLSDEAFLQGQRRGANKAALSRKSTKVCGCFDPDTILDMHDLLSSLSGEL